MYIEHHYHNSHICRSIMRGDKCLEHIEERTTVQAG